MKAIIFLTFSFLFYLSSLSQSIDQYYCIEDSIRNAMQANDISTKYQLGHRLIQFTKDKCIATKNDKDTLVYLPNTSGLICLASFFAYNSEIDSMSYYFEEAIKQGFRHRAVFEEYFSSFYPVYYHPIINVLRRKIETNFLLYCENSGSKINIELALELSKMWENDQRIRQEIQLIENIDYSENRRDSLTNEIKRIDASNVKRLKEIILQYGYPGKTLVGNDYSIVAFFIIQHSNYNFQKESLPLLEDAVKKGELEKSLLPALYDRLSMQKNNTQQYGTQRE